MKYVKVIEKNFFATKPFWKINLAQAKLPLLKKQEFKI